jgi:hypothetical protein
MAGPITDDSTLTVGELIDLLSEFDPGRQVHLAVQPPWPFDHTLAAVAAGDDETGLVYLAEGTQLGYLPDSARHALLRAGDARWSDPE